MLEIYENHVFEAFITGFMLRYNQPIVEFVFLR